MSDLRFAQFLTVILGLLVTCIGSGVAYLAQVSERNIVDMMAPAFNMFLGPLASLFLIGMFTKCNGRVALVTVVCSTLISFFWSYWKILFKTTDQPTITLSTAVPYLASYVIASVLSLLSRTPADAAGLEYTWSAVMKRPLPQQDE
ncbi:MAG: hypothetical protein FJ267_03020 [Planctomycetes bacterium]|nr:hypothetical protein [Planctomycetota bacterium]